MFRSSLGLVFILCLGCSGSAVTLDGGPPPDGALPAGRVTIESAPSLTLAFGQQGDVVVRYTEADVPIAGVAIRFLLEGRAHDSTLTDLVLTTDRDGRVRTAVVAGSVTAAFRIRVDADRAPDAYINVAVGNEGFGALRVDSTYSGVREGVHQRVVEIFASMDCASIGDASGDWTMALTDTAQNDARFSALPVGPSYAVAGRVESAGGIVLARACTDGVQLTADTETSVVLEFVDRALSIDGTYATEVVLGTDAPATSVQALMSASATTIVSASGSPGGLYLDALDAELADRSLLTAREALARQRPGTDAELDAALEAAGTGPEAAIDRLALVVFDRISEIRLLGALGVGAASASWAPDTITLPRTHDPDGSPLALAPADVLSGPIYMSATVAGDGAGISVDSLTIPIGLGTLVDAALRAEAAGRGASDPVELAIDGAGCESLATVVAAHAELSACDATCAHAACTRALGAILALFSDASIALDATETEIDASGTLDARDADGDLVPETLVQSAPWPGTWSGIDAVSATITATRTGP